MTITLEERETIIVFNEKDDTASVDTCNGALIRKLDKLITCQESKQISLIREDEFVKVYVIPKKWVKVNLPQNITDEERAKRSAAARARFGHKPQTTDFEPPTGANTDEAHEGYLDTTPEGSGAETARSAMIQAQNEEREDIS